MNTFDNARAKGIADEKNDTMERQLANIDTMKVAELRAELARHGQSITGLLKRDLRRCLKQLYRQKALAAKEIAEEKKANTNRKFANAHANGEVIELLDDNRTDDEEEIADENKENKQPTLDDARAKGKVIARLDGTTTARANETVLELEDGLDGYQQMTESTVTMTLEDLRAHLAKHGQDTEGSRDMLRQRLVKFYHQNPHCVHSSGTAIDESAKDKDGNEDDDSAKDKKQQFDNAFAKKIAEEKKDNEKRKFENAAWEKYGGYTKKELTALLHKNDIGVALPVDNARAKQIAKENEENTQRAFENGLGFGMQIGVARAKQIAEENEANKKRRAFDNAIAEKKGRLSTIELMALLHKSEDDDEVGQHGPIVNIQWENGRL